MSGAVLNLISLTNIKAKNQKKVFAAASASHLDDKTKELEDKFEHHILSMMMAPKE